MLPAVLLQLKAAIPVAPLVTAEEVLLAVTVTVAVDVLFAAGIVACDGVDLVRVSLARSLNTSLGAHIHRGSCMFVSDSIANANASSEPDSEYEKAKPKHLEPSVVTLPGRVQSVMKVRCDALIPVLR